MKRKHSANVLIVEVDKETGSSETGADKVVKSLLRDSAKARKRAEIEKRTIVEANQKRQREAAAKSQDIKARARVLIAVDARLSRKPYVLAQRLRKLLLKQGKDYSIKTIVRALKK
jgi:hypothetical protein